MTEKIILYTIIVIAISVILVFLTKATRKAVAIDNDGHYVLRMNKLYGVIGFVCLVIGLLFLIFLPLTAEPTDRGVWVVTTLMLLIFLGIGIPCLMYYRNHRVVFNNNSIIATNIYGQTKEIKWSDINDINFNALSGLLVLKTTQEKIKIHQHLVGLLKFIEHIENNTKWSQKELKLPIGK